MTPRSFPKLLCAIFFFAASSFAAAAGLGGGMNPLAMVAGDIRSGRLVPLIAGSTLPVPLTWQVARGMAPALAEVTRAVQKSARQYLTQD